MTNKTENRMTNIIPKEIEEIIVRMFIEDKLPIISIHRKLHYGRPQITRVIKKHISEDDFSRRLKEIRNANDVNNTINLPLEKLSLLHNKDKLSIREIADKYNVSYQTVSKLFKNNKLERHMFASHRTRGGKEVTDEIIKLYDSGYPLEQIAEKVNRNKKTVAVYLRRNGRRTHMFGLYNNRYIKKEELQVKKYLENKGVRVERCLFVCQRNVKVPVRYDLREFCDACPVKNLKFDMESQERYDFMCKDNQGYFVCEAKNMIKRRYNKYVVSHFCFGQFNNLGVILRANIRFLTAVTQDGIVYEKWV